jgi:uncharacterized protein involved in outer membrane biogenesis
MNNVLLMLGAIVAGILAALVAVPMAIDWNGYRGVFEEEASRLLGRDVRLGGGVNVRVLPVPYVRFEKLRIADKASNSRSRRCGWWSMARGVVIGRRYR